MAKKTLRKKMKKGLQEEEDIREEDIIGEVHFEIDKNAFKGPFTCCSQKTKSAIKNISIKGPQFTYDVWRCGKCGKEYLDTKQAGIMEKFWGIRMLLEGKAPTMERSLNYDGKAYFVRFPKDLTGSWNKGKKKAIITMLTPEKYFVEIT